jgi:hypothetical protein
MPYNLRSLPQYPWQSQVPASPSSEQPIGLHRNRDILAPNFSGEHLDIDNTSEQAFAVVPEFRILHLDEMDSVHHAVRQGPSQAPQMVKVYRIYARTTTL